ncbi:MAG: alpha-galactosidase [Clostridia bacterium]|nr:alpha-galactosidase [Clostridia bacterium]
MKKIEIRENGVGLVFYLSDEGKVALRYCGNGVNSLPEPKEAEFENLSPVVIATSERGFVIHRGAKKINGGCSSDLRYLDLTDEKTDYGRLVRLVLGSDEAQVVCAYAFYNAKGKSVLRTWTEMEAKRETILEYVSAFFFEGFYPPFEENAYERIQAYIPHNTWHGEGQWTIGSLASFGLNGCHASGVNLKRIAYGNTGTWSSKEYLPAGALSSGDEFLFWQIEANGSWHAEIGQNAMLPYLALSGPTFAENGWQKKLNKGEKFVTPTVALSFGKDLNDCSESMTNYRRSIASVYLDDVDIPSQYNGYMHANWDNPRTEAVLAQMQACKKAGVDVFVVDAGWFSQGVFWRILGDWLHPIEPFEQKSFREIIDICHGLGMKAGLWLELEDVGTECPILPEIDELLMRRNGIKVCDNYRYFLDFSKEKTRAYMDRVVDTVVNKYGVDYIKLDYNCDAGVGCDSENGSFAEGLLEHNRAFADWIEAWHNRNPNLVIEGCASGGMRLDYKSLSLFALGNTSDQVLYNRTPYIACNLASYLVPERMGVWSYPIAGQTDLQVNMNLVNGVLFRMQLAGEVHKLGEEQSQLVKDGVDFYNSIKDFKKRATPYLPMGYCKFFDQTIAFGLKDESKLLLAVYNLSGDRQKKINLSGLKANSVKRVFPFRSTANAKLENGELIVAFEHDEEAAIFELEIE